MCSGMLWVRPAECCNCENAKEGTLRPLSALAYFRLSSLSVALTKQEAPRPLSALAYFKLSLLSVAPTRTGGSPAVECS
eukprot:1904682-Karenia_brevis.AAC.1